MNSQLRKMLDEVGLRDAAGAAWEALWPLIHVLDREVADQWRPFQEAKFIVARCIRARRICEIGVRAGYSAFMLLRACPQAFFLGIDNDSSTHGGISGMVNYARRLLQRLDFALLIYDSQRMQTLPGQFDLVHVDGDHSYEGTLHDLELAWSSGGHVLVDDYGLIQDVRRATDEFCATKSVLPEIVDDKQVLLWQ